MVILNVGKYAPEFKMGFSIMCGVSVLQFCAIFLIKFVSERYGTVKSPSDEHDEASDAITDEVVKPLN